ncbi:MAG: hypothetical protein SFW62_04360 [Alphaproteobacteria bacterium]|nr:hypothetical protein [Alphaproteobacteria bacterium]
MKQSSTAISRETTVYALTSFRSALHVIDEITSERQSVHPVARAIIDNNIGWAFLGVLQPMDSYQERILKINTSCPAEAIAILSKTYGVEKVSRTLQALVQAANAPERKKAAHKSVRPSYLRLVR